MNFNSDLDNINIITLLENDDISRNKYLLNFLKIINNNGQNRIFSLNGHWGSGKTIFVKKLVLLIKYCYLYDEDNLKWENLFSKFECFNDEELNRLKILCKKENYKEFNDIVKNNLINCVYFNAWEHDDEDDPIISIIYELIKKYNLIDNTQNVKLNSVLDEINIILKNLSFGKLDFQGTFTRESLSENINKKENIQNAVQNVINSIIDGNCNKLVIFIDELDRCKPFYAIKLLERIKHYFVDDRIVIVVSTNIMELANTISALYGNKFSSESYLDKFFNVRLELPNVELKKYINTIDTIVNRDSSAWISIAINSFIKQKKLQLREINRYLGCLKFFENKQNKKDYSFDSYNRLIDYMLIPYVVGLYVTNVKEYNECKKANGWDNLKKFIENDEDLIRFCKYNLFRNEEGVIEESDINGVLGEVEKLYNLIFNKTIKKEYSYTKIGNLTIYYETFKDFDDKISILGSLSDFGESY